MTAHPYFRSSIDPDDLAAPDDDADDLDDAPFAAGAVARRADDSHPTDPATWLASTRMTQTELTLRLARHLLTANLTASDISVALTGHELTRRELPKFPVERFLIERGFQRPSVPNDWRGTYLMKGTLWTLALHSEPDAGDVVATLTSGRRLIVQTCGGLLVSTRSPAEHRLLRAALGRAITLEHTEPADILAVAVPRSKRFRELAVRWRAADGVARAGVWILTVDRVGQVDGLPRSHTRE